MTHMMGTLHNCVLYNTLYIQTAPIINNKAAYYSTLIPCCLMA